MMKTIPADYIEKPEIGYLYVALLSENSRRQISELLRHLANELPGVIWPMPPEALHVTLYEIIQARKTYSLDKNSLYEANKDVYEQGPISIFAKLKSFEVTFDSLEASENAIIVRATDDGQFAATRESIGQAIPIPIETKRPPDIIHSSIARYKQAVELERVQEAVGRHTISFNEPIFEFKLLRTLVPPLLEYQEIANYSLTK